jgi:hypothetical protein
MEDAHIIRKPYQCGRSPWMVFLMVNIAKHATKKTEIRIHNDPSIVEYIQNNLHSSPSQMWRVIIAIGYFDVWLDALQFCVLWESNKRGCKSRLEHGALLFSNFKNQYNLQLQITPQAKEDVEKIVNGNKIITMDNYDNNDDDDENSINNILVDQVFSKDDYVDELVLNEKDKKQTKMWWNLSTTKDGKNEHFYCKTLASILVTNSST